MTYNVPTLLSHISRLNRKLSYLEQHHKHCPLVRERSPLSSDKSDGGSDHDPEEIRDVAYQEDHDESELKIVPYRPLLCDQEKKGIANNRSAKWKSIANQMLDSVPNTDGWIDLRQSHGIATDEDNRFMVATIAGYFGEVSNSVPERVRQLDEASITDRLIHLTKAYARITQSSKAKADLACRIHIFQELVLVSLCAVLEYRRISVDIIDEIMRICISNSQATNLQRLRRGAVWVNEVIVALEKASWQHRATELFFLCGLSLSKYSILSSSKASLQFIVNRLKEPKYDDASRAFGGPNRVPFSIPAFIKALVDDILTLDQICEALGYTFSQDLDYLGSRYARLGEHVGSFKPLTTCGIMPDANTCRTSGEQHATEDQPQTLQHLQKSARNGSMALDATSEGAALLPPSSTKVPQSKRNYGDEGDTLYAKRICRQAARSEGLSEPVILGGDDADELLRTFGLPSDLDQGAMQEDLVGRTGSSDRPNTLVAPEELLENRVDMDSFQHCDMGVNMNPFQHCDMRFDMDSFENCDMGFDMDLFQHYDMGFDMDLFQETDSLITATDSNGDG